MHPGLTLDDLVGRTGCSRKDLALVLDSEIRIGRVCCEDGRYLLRPGALDPDVAAALRGLSAPDVSGQVVVRRRGRRVPVDPPGGPLCSSERRNLAWVVY